MKRLRMILILLIIAFAFCAAFFTIRYFERKPAEFVKSAEGISQEVIDKNEKKLQLQKSLVESFAEKRELVTFEAELSEMVTWDESWGDIGLFRKSQRVKLYGKGIYVCDLSGFTAADIQIDDNFGTAVLTVPEPVVKTITIDEGKTEYEDVDKGWLRFGEIKLTQEQHSLMYASVKESMNQQMERKEILEKAKEATQNAVKGLFDEVVKASGAAYEVKVQFR